MTRKHFAERFALYKANKKSRIPFRKGQEDIRGALPSGGGTQRLCRGAPGCGGLQHPLSLSHGAPLETLERVEHNRYSIDQEEVTA